MNIRIAWLDKLEKDIKRMDLDEVNDFYSKLPYQKVDRVSSGSGVYKLVGYEHFKPGEDYVYPKHISINVYSVQNFLINAIHRRRDRLYE